MRRKEQGPARIIREFGGRDVESRHTGACEIVRIHKNHRLRFPPPYLFGYALYELEFPLVVVSLALRAETDRVIGRLDHQSVCIRIKIEVQLTDVFEHEPLRFRPRWIQCLAPAVNTRDFREI